jgi:hypothetical protein
MAIATPNPPEKKVNWEVAKACFAALHQEAPAILQQGVIIGGVACWFYRNLLAKANDPDFKVPTFSEEQERYWLSKDIDFTNFFAEDARRLLEHRVIADQQGRRSLQLDGIPIGFAQVGLTFDPETAWSESWIASFEWHGRQIECRVIDPVALYLEKFALVQRRGSNSDRVHCSLLAEFLRYEVCKEARALTTSKTLEDRSAPVKLLISIRDRALEICQNDKISARLQKIIAEGAALTSLERKLLTSLAVPNR